MAQIRVANAEDETIEFGDWIILNGEDVYYCIKAAPEQNSTRCYMVNMKTHRLYQDNRVFEHPVHLRNHLNKHYPNRWTFFDSDEVEINIGV